jgi:NAD(P)-dependent dehydrogenase (short-subunit alcohol dehydrogenase family)
MKRRDGKRALITGVTGGIGLETAHQFLASGDAVTVGSELVVDGGMSNL